MRVEKLTDINIVPERSVKCFALTSGLDVFFLCVCVSICASSLRVLRSSFNFYFVLFFLVSQHA